MFQNRNLSFLSWTDGKLVFCPDFRTISSLTTGLALFLSPSSIIQIRPGAVWVGHEGCMFNTSIYRRKREAGERREVTDQYYLAAVTEHSFQTGFGLPCCSCTRADKGGFVARNWLEPCLTFVRSRAVVVFAGSEWNGPRIIVWGRNAIFTKYILKWDKMDRFNYITVLLFLALCYMV